MALTIVLQSLRLVLPLPPVLSTFIIGTLVNMMLVITCRICGLTAAVMLTLLLPVLAFMQGQLLLPLLIPVVVTGNLLYVLLVRKRGSLILTYFLPPLLKAAVMYAGARIILTFVHIPFGTMADNILFAMTVPQLVTGIAGIAAAERILLKLKIHIEK